MCGVSQTSMGRQKFIIEFACENVRFLFLRTKVSVWISCFKICIFRCKLQKETELYS